MPAATPPSIRSSTGLLSVCCLVWSCGSTVVGSMPPACCAVPGQGEPWRPPWPDHDGATPEDGWPRRRRPWRRWRYHQWVGRPHGSGPLRRSPEDRLVAGLAAGIAARTGVDVTLVRLVFVVAALLGGFGVAAYVAGWLLL